AEDLDDPLDLALASEDRIELPLARELREIATELVEAGRIRLLFPFGLLLLGMTAQELERLVAYFLAIDAHVGEHLGGNALSFADQSEQEMLGPDIVVAELARFIDGELQHSLGVRSERDLADGERPAGLRHHALHGMADRVEIESQIGQDGRGDPLSFAEESEEQMLRPDGIVLETARLLARKEDHLADALCELVMHRLGCSSPALRSGFESGNVSHFQNLF